MLQYIQLASPENNIHTKNYFGQFTAAMTKGMHMMIIFILYYVLSKDDSGRIMPPNAPFKGDIVLLTLKVEK